MKTILGIILILAGGYLFFLGFNRKESLAGEAATLGTKVANSIDGGTRTPRHVGYMVGGGALALVGIAMVAKRGPRVGV